jgi:hypothetical protein
MTSSCVTSPPGTKRRRPRRRIYVSFWGSSGSVCCLLRDLSGKMTGVEDYNFALSNCVAAELRAQGHVVFNPAEADVEGNVSPSETAIGGSHGKKVIRRGLCWILDSADEIAMLPGWQESKGACAEKATGVDWIAGALLKHYEKVMLVYQLCTNFLDI